MDIHAQIAKQYDPTCPDEIIEQEVRQQMLGNEEKIGKERKALWARVYGRVFQDKAKAYEYMAKLCKKVGAWSPNEMTLEQIEEAYNLTNEL